MKKSICMQIQVYIFFLSRYVVLSFHQNILRLPNGISPSFHFNRRNLSNLLYPPIALKAAGYRERPQGCFLQQLWFSLHLVAMKISHSACIYENLPNIIAMKILQLSCSYGNLWVRLKLLNSPNQINYL